MASALALYLRAELTRRGWTQAELADKAGIQRTTLGAILKKPNLIPELATLAALAPILGVDLAKLVVLCGFTVGKETGTSQAEQISLLLAVIPELSGFFEILVSLRAEDIRAIKMYVDGVTQKKNQDQNREERKHSQ